MKWRPYPSGSPPIPPGSGGAAEPEPPLERVVPVSQGFDIVGERCFITSIEVWSGAFIIRYMEFSLSEEESQDARFRFFSRPSSEEIIEEAARRGTFSRGMLAGVSEVEDDEGKVYRRVSGSESKSGKGCDGRMIFNPALSPAARELKLAPRDALRGEPLAEIVISLQ